MFLDEAAAESNIVFAQLLIDNDIDLEMKNTIECTPLHYACRYGQIEIVQLLFNFIFGIKIQRRLFWGVILNNCELHPRFFFAIMPIFLNHYQALKSHEEEHFFSPKKILGNFTTKTNLWGNSLYFK